MQTELSYPDSPGWKDPNGRQAAKELNQEKIKAVYAEIQQAILNLTGATTEEIIKVLWFKRTDDPEDKFDYALRFSDFVGYIEPRISELRAGNYIKESDMKGKTRRNKTCEVWVIA